METTVLRAWDALRAKFWFIPTILSTAAILLAGACLGLDAYLGAEVSARLPWFFVENNEDVRSLMATLIGAFIGVFGVVFSITVVVLTLAASQMGPRLLRNFMRDARTQSVLGILIANAIYCLAVLYSVGRFETIHDGYIPRIATFVAVILALAGIGALIYFINHIAESIQIPRVVGEVSCELDRVIDRLLPERDEHQPPAETDVDLRPMLDERAVLTTLPAPRSGYLQTVDEEGLVSIASEHDLVVRVLRRPGHFTVERLPLIEVHGRQRPGDETLERIGESLYIGSLRTPTQDIEFVIRQLTEIAVRALSPGINDPNTAVACIDQLGAGLSRIARRDLRSDVVVDHENRPRLLMDRASFTGMTREAFEQIRQYGRASAPVLTRLLESLAQIAPFARDDAQREALHEQARLVAAASAELPHGRDREAVIERLVAVERILNAGRRGETDAGRPIDAPPNAASPSGART